MTIVVSDCQCDNWDTIGAPVKTIPDCQFGGILYFTDPNKAIQKWWNLAQMNRQHWCDTIPYYWAVHINRKHIVNVVDDGRQKITVAPLRLLVVSR